MTRDRVLTTHSLISNFLRGLRRFRSTGAGNVTVIFALALLPIVGLIGAAVDYSRANAMRTAMQQALDSTALMLSKDVTNMSATQLNSSAKSYFDALYNQPEVTDIVITPSYTAGNGSSVTVTGTGTIKTYFMGVFGFSTLKINGASTVSWGQQRLRVALVLDTTGSMASDNKMTALKTATKNLLIQLQAAATTNGDVYVSIIPFSKDTNAGPANYTENWVDWTEWEAEPAFTKPGNWAQIGPGSACPFGSMTHGFRCTSGPANDSPIVSTIPASGSYKGYICPSVDNGAKDKQLLGRYYNGCYDSVPTTTTKQNTVCTGWGCSCGYLSNCSCTGYGYSRVCTQTVTTSGAPYAHNWIKNARSTWTGCVLDRGFASGPSPSNYDQKVTPPTTSIPDTLFPAEQYSYCSPAIMGLNYNWSAMKAFVDGLFPSGSTNQPIGLVWGWQSLVGGGPFTAPVKQSGYTYQEVIVLMSDGLNTQDRWYGDGSNLSTSVDKRMYDSSASGSGTCANIKATGVVIYAIHVNTDGDPMSTLLKNCASSADKFWMVTTSDGIVAIFNQIGTSLSQLRISK